MSNTITTWLTTPIGRRYPFIEQSTRRNSEFSSVITSVSPITLISASAGVLGLVISFFGALTDKATKWFGLILSGLGIGGLICGGINDFKIYKKENSQLIQEVPIPAPAKKTRVYDFDRDLDILLIDFYHARLNDDLDKIAKIIERGKKLSIKELSLLLTNKNIDVKNLALLSLILKEDYDAKTKELILENIKKHDSLLDTLKKLIATEKDNQVIFLKLVDLIGSSY